MPKTRYAKSGDVSIAYQVFGDGELDLLLIPGFISHLEVSWMSPNHVAAMERLASFARVITFDKRGTGMSDPVSDLPSLEVRMDDARAVLDAVDSKSAAVMGFSEGAAMAALFAATYPQRTRALVLYGGLAKGVASDDYPWAPPAEIYSDEYMAAIAEHWGEGSAIETFLPNYADDEQLRQGLGMFERMAASPGSFLALYKMFEQIDVRHVLPAINVPTLVMHRKGDKAVNVRNSRYIADQIPGAKYVELEGQDHNLWYGDSEPGLREIQTFLTGTAPPRVVDRILATVMFTDIVDSTRIATELGDARWRELLVKHNRVMQSEIERHRGRLVKNTGDGFMATFDGPARAVSCASAAVDAVKSLGIEIRAGLHTGECEVIGDDIGGIAVHIAARVGTLASAGEVLVSRTVKDLVAGAGLSFEDRGERELKGFDEPWRIYAVIGS